MKRYALNPLTILCVVLIATLISCHREDPGPKQDGEKSFSAVDFDRLEISDGFDVTVLPGVAYSIHASGDYRNLNDMQVSKKGNTLVMKFNESRNRQYTTYITITMPQVKGVDFSGAVNGRVIGFNEPITRFDISLSGASVGQFNVKADEVYAWLTGASNARLTGEGTIINASVSGASEFTSYEYPAEQVESVVSGASRLRVKASVHLKVNASGASEVFYRGNPQVEAEVSGASNITKE